jgi:hypothetical protein
MGGGKNWLPIKSTKLDHSVLTKTFFLFILWATLINNYIIFSYSFTIYEFLLSFEAFLCFLKFISFYSFFHFLTYSEFIEFLPTSVSKFLLTLPIFSEFTNFLLSLPTFYWVYQLFIEFTNFLSSLPTFYRVYQLFIEFIDFFHFYWLLNYVFFSADFYRLFPTLPTVNRKFLITDFRLLSTSVKPENIIDFYRSKKKMKHPQCLNNCIHLQFYSYKYINFIHLQF